MLQIISGKFYTNENVFENPTEMHLYSNAIINKGYQLGDVCVEPIRTVSNVDEIKDNKSSKLQEYIIRFNNRIEQQSPTYSIRNAWSDVVLLQFKHILTFYLSSFWDEDANIVRKMCKEKVGLRKRVHYVPSNYLRSLLDKELIISEETIQGCIQFMNDLVALRRKDYENIITCIRSYCSSIRLLENDPNLAYSMLVFALESLSQSYDEYEPVWEDYNENLKGKLEKKFKDIECEKGEEIKDILIKDSHLKLSKRFLHFILQYLDDDFFLDHNVQNKILKDDVEQALKNAYNIRSRYAHALKLIVDQSVVDDMSKMSDYYRSNSEPFLTYSGLLRLTRYVILKFVTQREKVERERIDWAENLPGMLNVKLGPEFWLSNMESDSCLGASKRLEGYIQMFSNNKVYDITKVMNLYMSKFDQLSEELKRSIFSLCVIWKDTVNHDEEKLEKYNNFVEKHKDRVKICCIQNVVMFTFSLRDSYTVEWDDNELEAVLIDYIKKRRNDKAFIFPNFVETNMYLLAADILKEDKSKSEFWIDKAKYNSANNTKILKIVLNDEILSEKIKGIWDLIWEKDNNEESTS